MTAPRDRALPWVTIGAALAVCATFGAELSLGIDAWRPSAGELAAIGARPGAGVAWRLALAPFVHVGVVHLAFNLIGLALVAEPLERTAGRATALVALAGGALGGAALHLARQPYDLSVGASGATFACGAALAVLVMRAPARATALRLAVFVAINLAALLLAAIADVGASPDGWAHAGGAIAGALVAIIAGPRPAPLRTVAAALAMCAGAAALVASARPAIDWPGELSRAAAIDRHFDDVLPDTLTAPSPELAARIDTEILAPLRALRDDLGADDPRMPAAIARRRNALRAYLDARARAFDAARRYLTSADAQARADFEAANRDADSALAAAP